ncbi:MAG: CDP-alcohol phosphatidyltransferase family protein [Oscillospiraceae bacterium]|nr:CDP-alcohol phosphatidyltransferase family protein [Oscillospiraceae bacterium]
MVIKRTKAKAKLARIIPNALTLINLCLGLFAMLLVFDPDKSRWFIACLLVLIAAVMDRFDGKAARLFGTTSDLGRELDSLCDLVSFGVAPIVITWKLCFSAFGIPGYLLCLAFPMAGAYRLARFNVTTFQNIYMGMPITIAGSFLTLLNLYNWYSLNGSGLAVLNTAITIAVVHALSFLMVCTVKIRKM